MKKPSHQILTPDFLLDCSQADQINLCAEMFQVSPQAIKSAVRACCNNSVACISAHLQKKLIKIPSHFLKTNF